MTITGNIAHAISTKAGWTVVNNQIVSKGYKIAGSLEDKAHASAAGGAQPPTVPDVDDGPDSIPDGGGVPRRRPSADDSDGALGLPSRPRHAADHPAFHAELARKLGVTLKIGNGDAGGDFVLANAAGVKSGATTATTSSSATTAAASSTAAPATTSTRGSGARTPSISPARGSGAARSTPSSTSTSPSAT